MRRVIRGADLTCVQLDQMLDDREAESGPAGVAALACTRLVDAIEPLEDTREIRFGNARPLVSDRDDNAIGAAARPHGDTAAGG